MGPRADPVRAAEFAHLVDAPGFWPGRSRLAAARGLLDRGLAVAGVVLVVLLGLVVGHRALFAG
jgi:hypothetical protein